MTKHNRGFTLIELIVVILILGILAAVAAPKFVDLTGQARSAALSGLRAAVSSAATMANALQVAQNLTSGASVTIEGVAVTMVNGYPTADTTGISQAVRFDATTFQTSGAGPMLFQITALPACQFSYAAAVSPAPPVITAVTGC